MLNEQKVIGNLAADAKVKEIGNDRAIVNFRVGTTHRVVSKDHPAKEHTEWFNVRLFCSVAAAQKFFANKLTKGALVYFSGRTITETYTTKDGKGSSTVVECDPRNVVPLSKSESESESKAHDTHNHGHSNTVTNGKSNTNRMDLMNFD